MKKHIILASFSLIVFVGMALPAVAATCTDGTCWLAYQRSRDPEYQRSVNNVDVRSTSSNRYDRNDDYYYDNDRVLETFRHGNCKYTVRRVNGDERITRDCND